MNSIILLLVVATVAVIAQPSPCVIPDVFSGRFVQTIAKEAVINDFSYGFFIMIIMLNK